MTTPAAPDPRRWRERPPERFGLMSGYAWATDPKHVLFTLARYKFVAKLLAGKGRVLEIGCADAFGTRLVAQEVGDVVGIDVDVEMLKSAEDAIGDWRIQVHHHDLLAGPFPMFWPPDAAYAIDVLEHIHPEDEDRFLTNAIASVVPTGLLILGMPSRESQAYASAPSREGHVNCKSLPELYETCARHFTSVLMFGQNDEVVHTGFGPLCHYLWAICSGPR